MKTLINPTSQRDLTRFLRENPSEVVTLQGLPSPARRVRPHEVINFAETKSDIAALLLPGLKTVFADVFQAYPSFYVDVTTVIPSDKDTEHYGWLGATPTMNQFVDERKIQDLNTYTYAIQNKTWESTIALDRTALEDDLTGQLAMRVRQMAEQAKTHLDFLLFTLLASGFATAGYDGANFFGNHTQGGITQSNKLTEVLAAQGLQDAITAMQRFKDDYGRPMGIQPDTLVVPPELAWEAWTLMNSAFFPDPVVVANQQLGANPLRGMLRVISVPYLTDTNDWFLCDCKRVIKALILQMRKDFEFDALEVNSETGFLRDKYYYGVRARYNAGFGEWRCALGSQN